MTDDKPVKKMNANTIYRDEIHPDIALRVFSTGLDIPSVCAEMGVSKKTYHEWYNIYPVFAEACDRGKALGEHWWDVKAKEHAVIVQEPGGPKTTFDTGLYKFTKKINYKARESEPATIITDAATLENPEKIKELKSLVANLHKDEL